MSRSQSSWPVRVGDAETLAVHDPATGGSDGPRVVFVCAHGAGGNRRPRFGFCRSR